MSPDQAIPGRRGWLYWLLIGQLDALLLFIIEILSGLPIGRNYWSLKKKFNIMMLSLIYPALGLGVGVIFALLRPKLPEKRQFLAALGPGLTILVLGAAVYYLDFFAFYYLAAIRLSTIATSVLGLGLMLFLLDYWRRQSVTGTAWLWVTAALLAFALTTANLSVTRSHLFFRTFSPQMQRESSAVAFTEYKIPMLPPPPVLPDVVLICVDTLRADALGCYGNPYPPTPHLDAFARSGVMFEAALAQSSWTLPSVASYLTGLAPHKTGATKPLNPLQPFTTTLAEILKAYGYRTAAFIGNPLLGHAFQFDQGFDRYDDQLVATDMADRLLGAWLAKKIGHWRSRRFFKEAPASIITQRYLDWMKMAGAQPKFAYLHYVEPHSPYLPDPQTLTRLYPAEREAFARVNNLTTIGPEQIDAYKKLYLAGVSQFDGEFGKLIDSGKQNSKRPTLYIVLSDHGEAFLEHGQLEHGKTVFNEEIRVPFIWSMPGVLPEGKKISDPVALLDLLPTVCGMCNLPVPPWAEGIDLFPAMQGRGAIPARPIFSELDQTFTERHAQFSAQLGFRKIVYDDVTHSRAFYDLTADSQELKPLPVGASDEFASLAGLLAKHLHAAKSGNVHGTPVNVDQETNDLLRSMGYLE